MTFDSDLMRAQGVAMGEEFTGKGINVALGPAMNLARAPAAGRNWEGAGGNLTI
jgi:beta-glucosidase